MARFLIIGMVVVLAGLAWAHGAWAQDTSPTDGQIAMALSQQLYCQAKGVLSGNLGLLAGMVIALYGLYTMINGAVSGGLILVICGALLTALPSLVQSTMQGLSGFLTSTQISAQALQIPPGC
jgi:hypothetical protein